jgi:crotonobetainyl-CoA:carnitine CoA-transferase CaiB-like acyl-CoA transferase
VDSISQSQPQLPFSGVRVVDLTHDWAGPRATRMLADFGAEVIKIENSRRMDSMRGAFKENQAYNRHPRWFEINRNKLSVTLDLRNSMDIEAFRDLVAISDVVVDSSRAGVMERLGIGYENLRGIRSDIILVSMSAFGHTGPESSYGGYGGGIEPMSGLQPLTSYNRGEVPVRIREVDVTNGLMGACAIITALLYRQRTGQGQYIDLSQLESATVALAGEHLLEYVMNGVQTLPVGNRHPSYAPQGCYRCKGEDKWVALVVRSEEEWRSLCEVIEHPGLLEDSRFSSALGRAHAHDDLDRLIEQWAIQHSHIEAMHLLQKAGVCAGAVLNVSELAMDPHLREHYFQSIAERNTEGERRMQFPGFPFRISDVSPKVTRKGPSLGEHNEYVLCELLGRPREDLKLLSEDEIGTAYDIE